MLGVFFINNRNKIKFGGIEMEKYEMKITFTDEEMDELIWTALVPKDGIDGDGELEAKQITLRAVYEHCKFMQDHGDWSTRYPEVKLRKVIPDKDDLLLPMRLLEEDENMKAQWEAE